MHDFLSEKSLGECKKTALGWTEPHIRPSQTSAKISVRPSASADTIIYLISGNPSVSTSQELFQCPIPRTNIGPFSWSRETATQGLEAPRKGQSSSQFPRREVLKNMLALGQLLSSPMLVRSCLKSCMLDFSIMWIKNFQISKLGLEKEEELESKLPTFAEW